MLFYTPTLSPRIRYIVNYLLHDIVGIKKIYFSSNIEEAESYSGAIINYSNYQLKNKNYWITPHGLLNESGVRGVEIYFEIWEELPSFFVSKRNNQSFFDVFAASFYLVSRYEEYLPTIRDKYDRFDSARSIAHKGGFLRTAIVNRWGIKLREKLLHLFPEMQITYPSYSVTSTIDVDNAYAYKGKGIMRTMGAIAKSILTFDGEDFATRFKVLFKVKQDPYDTYEFLESIHKKYSLRPIFFFLFADYATNDKNLPIDNHSFIKLIKSIADHADIGIHPSFESNKYPEKLEKEIKNLSKIFHKEITKSRQHFLKLSFPETYKQLIELDITDDYTMGYATDVGFRAGTCTPFYFYDLDLEIETKLKVFPFQIMDATLLYYLKLSPESSIELCKEIIKEVKEVNGSLYTLWHNETVSEFRQWKNWKRVFVETVKYSTKR
jgi:hypothetical protein